jgi:hypothetical protein
VYKLALFGFVFAIPSTGKYRILSYYQRAYAKSRFIGIGFVFSNHYRILNSFLTFLTLLPCRRQPEALFCIFLQNRVLDFEGTKVQRHMGTQKSDSSMPLLLSAFVPVFAFFLFPFLSLYAERCPQFADLKTFAALILFQKK